MGPNSRLSWTFRRLSVIMKYDIVKDCYYYYYYWFVSHVCTEQIHMINLFTARNPPVPLKTTSSLVWSWRLWIGRTPTSFVPQRWERSEVRRSSSCLMAGEVPLTTGVPSTPETSSPWDGALWPNTLYSHRETSVSAAVVAFSLPLFLLFNNYRWQIIHIKGRSHKEDHLKKLYFNCQPTSIIICSKSALIIFYFM